MKYCSKCRIEYSDKFAFCKKCGQKLEIYQQQSQVKSSNTELVNNSGNKNDSKRWMIIGAVIIVLLAFFLIDGNSFMNKGVSGNIPDKGVKYSQIPDSFIAVDLLGRNIYLPKNYIRIKEEEKMLDTSSVNINYKTKIEKAGVALYGLIDNNGAGENNMLKRYNNLRRVSLMNVFKFNNKRIEIMNQAIKLRQDMATKMENLEKTLEEWNQNIMKKQNELNPDEEINEIKEEEELNINNDVTGSNDIQKIEEEEEINKKANLTTLGLGNIFGLNKKIPSDGSESNKLPLAKNPLSQSSLVTDSNTLVTSDEPYLTEEQVINKVKEWIINGFLIKLQIRLHKSVANYNNIPEKEKYIYERDIIQGKNQVTSSIENLIETELRSTKISDLTESEMKELKQYFDGSRAKKLDSGHSSFCSYSLSRASCCSHWLFCRFISISACEIP